MHRLVKAGEILLSPVASICSPSFVAGVNPCIKAIECVRILAGNVFINQQGRHAPCIYTGTHQVPVCVSSFWKYEDDWPAFVSEVCLMSGRRRRKIGVMKHRKVRDCLVSRTVFL